jgi:hypothetical protein
MESAGILGAASGLFSEDAHNDNSGLKIRKIIFFGGYPGRLPNFGVAL